MKNAAVLTLALLALVGGCFSPPTRPESSLPLPGDAQGPVRASQITPQNAHQQAQALAAELELDAKAPQLVH